MNTILRWISPLLLATVVTTGIRLVTDISSSCPFWNRPIMINLKDFISAIISCYLLDFLFRYLVKSKFRQEKGWKVLVEYSMLALIILIGTTISSFVAHYFIDTPNYLIDFVISYVVSIPICLFYYTMIRNSVIRQEYNQQRLQLEKIKSDQLATELNFLKAQYHPHFLFNALNTVYFQVDEENGAAKESIEHLSELLRYQLYDIKNEVSIKQEIHFLNSYIAFQKLRMSERLKLAFASDPQLDEQKIHPLLFQPLLENAFKYVNGEYWIDIRLLYEDHKIHFVVENAIDRNNPVKKKKAGIGIENLKRRLELLYPNRYTLTIEQREKTFYAELVIDIR